MKVIVTGGCGFIGCNFIRSFLARREGIQIVNIDKLSYGSDSRSSNSVGRNSSYAFIRGDIADSSLIREVVVDAEYVINFAAETHVDRSISSGLAFINSNVVGVYTLLEALRQSRGNPRLVQIGTDEEYGDIARGSFTELDSLTPSSPYAATKASASMLVLAYARTYGLNASITRCTNNFGPHQFPEKLIPKTIIRAALGQKIPLYGTGKNVRDWLYVEDHCEAIDKVLWGGRPGEVYNVSSGNERENLEVVSAILHLMGKPNGLIEHVEDRPGHDLRYSLDSSKIRDELGWRPKHSWRQALERTVDWYNNNQDWWRPLADERTLNPTPWTLRW